MSSYSWQDILIVGDSFCSERTEPGDWPQVLTCLLTDQNYNPNLIPRGAGFNGASWWSTRKNILNELLVQPVRLLVVCHTDPKRIPHDHDIGLNPKSVITLKVPNTLKTDKTHVNIIRAARNYYEFLMSMSFHLWAYKQWFREIDQIILDNNIEKAVHLFCFQDLYNDYTFQKGVTMTKPLYSYCNQEEFLKSSKFRREDEKTRNHFSLDQNRKFGSNLSTLIKNYPGDAVRSSLSLI